MQDCNSVKTDDWNAGRIEILMEMWPTHTAPEIGAVIGKTKNAIIGKARRLGLVAKRPARPHGARERSCSRQSLEAWPPEKVAKLRELWPDNEHRIPSLPKLKFMGELS